MKLDNRRDRPAAFGSGLPVRAMRSRRQSGCPGGFTLLELLIAVAIFGLLAAFAYPSYLDHARKTKRSAAKSALIELSSRQTQYHLDNKTYTSDLTNLGYPTSPAYIDSIGNTVTATATDRIYQIGAQAGTVNANEFTLAAIPQLTQTRDTTCATLRLSSTGQKTETGSGSASNCW